MIPKPGIHERMLTHSGQERLYHVHVPRNFESAVARPLLVVLHGGGGSAAFASRVYGWRELSHETGWLVVFPEAECEDPSSPAAVRENPRLWNDGSRRSAVARRNVDDIGYLSRVLDAAITEFHADERHVFVTGFSNGGSMAFRVGVEMAERVTAIAPVAGHLCVQTSVLPRPVSLFYMIGLEDPLNPFDGGPTYSPWGQLRQRPPVMQSIDAWRTLLGLNANSQTLRDSDGVLWVRYGPGSDGQQVQLCTIAGQGHEWPGARRTLPKSISGPQTDKVCGTSLIRDFFRSCMQSP